VPPYQRIEYTVGAYEMALREWDWCAAVAMWAFRYPRPTHTYQDYYALVTTDFVPKGVYLEAQRYAQPEAAP